MSVTDPCKVDGCGKWAQKYSLCSRHAQEDSSIPRCTYEGCEKSERNKGLCEGHYTQLRKGQELRPMIEWGKLPCRGPACSRNASFRDGYCKRHHAQKLQAGEVWVIGARRPTGRRPVKVCVEEGCESGEIVIMSRCLAHAVREHGVCWLPWCNSPGHHHSGLCDRHRRRQNWMMHKYGIGWQARIQLAESQNHACVICGKLEEIGDDGGLHIDHDHATGRVRGLLCGPCNRGIGLMQEDPKILQSAATYLLGVPEK